MDNLTDIELEVKEGDKPEELKQDPLTVTSLDLRGKLMHLDNFEDGLLIFQKLEVLNLSNNDLEDIDSLKLYMLPALKELDLRDNFFKDLSAVLHMLRSCDSLKVVYLHQSTYEDTNNMHKYVPRVFKELRSITHCDGLKNFMCIDDDPYAMLASQFFKTLLNIGPNSLNQINLRGRHLPDKLLPFIISALHQLETETVWADGNEWSQSPEYVNIMIVCLMSSLKTLDDVEITDDKKRVALNINRTQHYDKLLVPWRDVHHTAFESVNVIGTDNTHKQTSGLRDETSSLSVISANSELLSKLNHHMRRDVNITRLIFNKIEIITNYFQIYGIIIILHLGTLYPVSWSQFNNFSNFITLNFEQVYNINADYKVGIIFGCLVSIPVILFISFYMLSKLKFYKETYVKIHIKNWPRTKQAVAAIFTSLIIMLTVFGVEGSEIVVAWSALAIGFLMVLTGIWTSTSKYFRKIWFADQTQNKLLFWSKWLNGIVISQKLCLTIMNITFMPLCRNILSQFQCANGADLLYPAYKCFPSDVITIQYLAFLFGIAYIIGIPILYGYLIKTNVRLALDSSPDYKELSERIIYLKDIHLHGRFDYTDEIRKLTYFRQKLYRSITSNGEHDTPVSKLFSPFKHKYRYWILLRLSVVIGLLILNFIPNQFDIFTAGRDFIATLILFTYSSIMIVLRPYNDRTENIMDIISNVVNFFNSLITLGLNENLQDFETYGYALFGTINFVVVGVFGYGIITSPWSALKEKTGIEREIELEKETVGMIREIQFMDSIQNHKLESVKAIRDSSLPQSDSSIKIPVYDHTKNVRNLT